MKNLRYLSLLFAVFFMGNAAMSQDGKVRGRVFDAINNEALPFVNVVISGTNIGATTDEKGAFEIANVPKGFVQLAASFVGYEPALSAQVQVTGSRSPFVEIGMKQSATALAEVQVVASPFTRTDEAPVAMQRIGLKEIEGNPGSNRDISKVIQSFPGVGGAASFRNDIIIRGGGPSESRFYLDGVEIPNLNHFATQGASGGPVGIINADFISAVNFYTGAFPATRGNALSGVFDFTQVDGNKERQKVRLSLGASETSLTLDGPLSDKTSYIFSARRSYLQFLFKALQLPFLPTFTDYQFKVKTRFNPKNELTIVSIGALDEFTLNDGIENPTEEQQYIIDNLRINNQWNYAIGAVYKHFAEHSYHTFVLSRNMLNNEAYKYPENDETKSKIFDYVSQEMENKFRYEGVTQVGAWKLGYGAGAEYARYNNATKAQVLVASAPVAIDYQSDLDMWKWSVSAQVSRKFWSEKLSVSAGLRMDANSYSASMGNLLKQSSPRISASLALGSKTNLNANMGIYNQLPAYTTLGYREGGVLVNKQNGLKYIQATHYILGLEHRIKPTVIFTVEGFYKQYDNYPFSVKDGISLANKGADFGAIGDEEVRSIGKGRAYGLELLNRTRLDNGFNMVAAYTYVRSSFDDAQGNEIVSSWDNRHIFTLTATKDFKKNWTAGLKWRYVGGQPYTPWDLENSAKKTVWDAQAGPQLQWSALNSQRLGDFHQLDVRVDKKFFFNKWSLMCYIDIQNLYGFKAENSDNIVRERDTNGNLILENGGTSYKLKTLTNTSGTVLPTIGIMIEI
ncbi:MAG: hypothetical protein RIS47_2169 [Bacteroidota bacterium]